MLARLTQLPGVLRAEVDRSGRLFLLTLRPDTTLASLRAALGELRELPIEALPSTTWYSTENITQLSLLEAALLSTQWSTRAAEVIPDKSVTDRLCELLEKHLTQELLRVHAENNAVPGWYIEAFPRLVDEVLCELREALPESQWRLLREALRELLPA